MVFQRSSSTCSPNSLRRTPAADSESAAGAKLNMERSMHSIAHGWQWIQDYWHALPGYLKPILATAIVAMAGYLLRKVPRRMFRFILDLYDDRILLRMKKTVQAGAISKSQTGAQMGNRGRDAVFDEEVIVASINRTPARIHNSLKRLEQRKRVKQTGIGAWQIVP